MKDFVHLPLVAARGTYCSNSYDVTHLESAWNRPTNLSTAYCKCYNHLNLLGYRYKSINYMKDFVHLPLVAARGTHCSHKPSHQSHMKP